MDQVTGDISIRVTVAVRTHALPARSVKVKRNVPLPVKICPVALRPVTVSENPVMVAVTFPLVDPVGEKYPVAVGATVSQVIVTDADHEEMSPMRLTAYAWKILAHSTNGTVMEKVPLDVQVAMMVAQLLI